MQLNQQNKAIVWDFWHQLDQNRLNGIESLFRSVMDPQVKWHGPDPINDQSGIESVLTNFWEPLYTSFPDLTRQTHLFFGGQSNGRVDGDISKDGAMWVTGTGNFVGTFAHDYLGIPASKRPVAIRWGEFYRMEAGKITEIFCLLDLVDLMQQAGYDVLPPVWASRASIHPRRPETAFCWEKPVSIRRDIAWIISGALSLMA